MDEVWQLLDRLHGSIQAQLHTELADRGLIPPAFADVLRSLSGQPSPMSTPALRSALGTTQSGLSRRLARMQAAGLIKCATHPTRLNTHLVTITRQGRNQLAQAAPVITAVLEQQLRPRQGGPDIDTTRALLAASRARRPDTTVSPAAGRDAATGKAAPTQEQLAARADVQQLLTRALAAVGLPEIAAAVADTRRGALIHADRTVAAVKQARTPEHDQRRDPTAIAALILGPATMALLQTARTLPGTARAVRVLMMIAVLVHDRNDPRERQALCNLHPHIDTAGLHPAPTTEPAAPAGSGPDVAVGIPGRAGDPATGTTAQGPAICAPRPGSDRGAPDRGAPIPEQPAPRQPPLPVRLPGPGKPTPTTLTPDPVRHPTAR